MTTENNYSKILFELKTQYEETLSNLEAQTNQIKDKLTSLNTLMEHPSLGEDILSIFKESSISVTSAAETSQDLKREETISVEDQPQKNSTKALSSSEKIISSSPKNSTSSSKTKKKTQNKRHKTSSTKLPMKKPYDQMLKLDAISKILQENPGKVIHTDDLIKELFGDLSPEQYDAERLRMKTAMYRGVKLKRWIKVPKKQMCYVYESHLKAESEKAAVPKIRKTRKKTK